MLLYCLLNCTKDLSLLGELPAADSGCQQLMRLDAYMHLHEAAQYHELTSTLIRVSEIVCSEVGPSLL